MKKLFWGFIVVLLLVIGTVLVGPNVVDWNRYKGEVTRQAKAYTGRDLIIKGDVQVSLFPTPAVIANDVSFSNLDGAAASEMIKLQRAEVRIALSPLFAGQIKVETVRLIKPVIELELLADGRQNWEFAAPPAAGKSASAGAAVSEPTKPAGGQPPSVVLDDFTIIDGSLTYRDSKAGTVENIKGLNARIEAASLSGPFQSKGSLTLRSIPLTYDVTVGELIKERTLPLNMKLGVGAGDTSLHIGGTILGLTDDPKFKGTLKGEGKNLGLLIEAVTRTPAPPALAQLFAVEALVSASASGAELSGLQMQLADSRVEGDVAIEMSAIPRFSVNLTAGRFDLDSWLVKSAMPASGDKKRQAAAAPQSTAKGSAVPAPAQAAGGVVIPVAISGSVLLSVEALIYRGEIINDVLINTELADGVANLRQFSAQFPGGSEITMSGLLSSPGGKPGFSGTVETSTNDIRKVVSWLGVEFPNVPADRLRKMSFSTELNLTPAEVKLQNIDLKFDSSRLTGATTIALRARPGLGLNLTLDQINADAYLPVETAASKPGSSGQNGQSATVIPQGSEPDKNPEQVNPFQGLALLASFDANALLTVKRLVLRGEPLTDVVVDATLYDGGLEIRKMNIAEFSGASITTRGQVNNLRSIPEVKGLQVVAKAKDLTPLVRLLGIELPFSAKGLGTTSVDVRASGSILKPKIQSEILTAGGGVGIDGGVSLLPTGDLFDLGIKVSHPDFARLLRILGVNYRPAGKIGALSLSTQMTGDPKNVNFQRLFGNLGDLTYSGNAAVNLTNLRPLISADLNLGALILDTFLPAANSASLEPALWPALTRRPVVWPGPDRPAQPLPVINIATSARWPTDPIDLTALDAFDANIALKAPLVAYSKYLFEKVDVAAEIANGTLTAKRLTAQMFGGILQGKATVSSAKTNQVASAFTIAGINIAEALQSVTGKASASGVLNANLDFTAAGASVADIVSTLAGTGGFTMKEVDASASTEGSAFAGIYNLLTTLNRLGASRNGNKADVSGTFQIARGVARTNDFKLASALGNGVALGTVDLPAWLLNIEGQIELQQSALTQILQAKLKRGTSPVRFSLTGPIDDPSVKVDTGALLGSSLPIPGADTLLNKAPKGIGNLLGGMLGGSGATRPAAPAETTGGGSQQGDTPPPPRTTEPQQVPPSALRPEDLLKQLFK
ncbi:MAG: AsmA family protein [Rhodospirillales bacterium]|nr:AsmA family protein [Rhodospirillales bacterium]